MADRPTVLFACVHNAGRSQMAAAFAERHGGEGIEVLSAGTQPTDRVHWKVVEVMREIGIDLSDRRPRRLEDDAVRSADVVITMGCGEECPLYPGKRYEDWDVPDPGLLPLDEVRVVRDDIERRVTDLLGSFGV